MQMSRGRHRDDRANTRGDCLKIELHLRKCTHYGLQYITIQNVE